MSNYLLLIKIQLYSLFGLNKALHSKGSERKKVFKTAVLGVLVTLLFAGLFVFYNLMFATSLKMMGLGYGALIGAMFAASSALTLISTISKTNGTVFGFKDYDIIMSLPIKKTTVIAAKISFVYLIGLVFTAFSLIPAAIIYGIYSNSGVLFYVMFTFALFFAPIVPLVIGLIIGAIITYATSRFKKSNYISILLYIVFIVGIMTVSYSSQNEEVYADIALSLNRIYPLTSVFVNMLTKPDLLIFFAFILISAVLCALFVYGISLGFERINSAILTKKTGAKFSLEKTKSQSAVVALFKKEIKKFFSLPMYVLNSAVGAVLALLFSVYLLISKNSTMGLALNILIDTVPSAAFMLPVLICFILTMASSTTAAISLEGKNLWILKSSPVSASEIIISKLMVNNAIMLPAGLLSVILAGIAAKLSALQFIFSIILVALIALSSSAMGLLINLKYPRFDWNLEIQVIKQSLAVFLHMIISMLLMTILGVAVYFVHKYLSVLGVYLLLLAVFASSAFLHLILFKNGGNLFKKIEP